MNFLCWRLSDAKADLEPAKKKWEVAKKVNESSAQIVARSRLGDKNAESELFHRYVDRLLSLVQSQLGRNFHKRLDPEDAVYSAYRTFFFHLRAGRFQISDSGELWKLLVSITLNKLRRQLKHHQASKRSVHKDSGSVFLGDVIARGPSPFEALVIAEELEKRLENLKDWQQTVVRMRLQEFTWPEIALATGKSDRNIRRVISDLRKSWIEDARLEVTDDLNFSEGQIEQTSVNVNKQGPSEFLDYDDFLLQKLVGMGGFGKVYRAFWKSQRRTVALKMLRKQGWESPDAIASLISESKTIAQLTHPAIVSPLGIGKRKNGGYFLITELVEGRTLTRIISEDSPTIAVKLEWMVRLAEVVNYAHSRGVIHCDLKTDNVLIDREGRLFLSDFGLSTKRTTAKQLRLWAGTPGWMAPEQLDERFGKISPMTDVFGLGLLLVKLLFGVGVFEGKTITRVLGSDTIEEEWWLVDRMEILSPQLRKLISRCLRIDPKKRMKSAAIVASHLRNMIRAVS